MKTLAVLRQAYDDLHDRAYKLTTVLVAGGGAAGAYALSKAQASGAVVETWAPLAALALSWFGIAAMLTWLGATSKTLSPGLGPHTLLENYDWRKGQGATDAAALAATRRQAVEMEQGWIDAYRTGCISRADAVDMAYKAAALCTPLVPALVFLYCYFGR